MELNTPRRRQKSLSRCPPDGLDYSGSRTRRHPLRRSRPTKYLQVTLPWVWYDSSFAKTSHRLFQKEVGAVIISQGGLLVIYDARSCTNRLMRWSMLCVGHGLGSRGSF
ncbi:hypothetical protein BDV33DRAFT_12795 [Aspergillus novoparasiticus]|uniref:Uncharacterized protein n=1 Tax=Aspergillus novoparasiticus TaxID=986946 RepID=A0A5N6F2X0_9EURO|nr:hypothetical protein BDV33DRAFT_12795 [Aspergillus novoparasiticus]